MSHQLKALVAQLPPTPLGRAGVVAISVPVFFVLMLVAMLRGS